MKTIEHIIGICGEAHLNLKTILLVLFIGFLIKITRKKREIFK